MSKTLAISKSFSGKYVAIKDFDDATVVGDGTTAKEANDKAVANGYPDAVITFVPKKGMVHIY